MPIIAVQPQSKLCAFMTRAVIMCAEVVIFDIAYGTGASVIGICHTVILNSACLTHSH